MALVNTVRAGFYLDSVALMRLSQTLSGMPGIDAAALMIGSASNRQILLDAGLLTDEGRCATANDLIIAIRASSISEASVALATANMSLDQPRLGFSVSAEYRSRSIEYAKSSLPSANLTLISVPGEFAAHEARKALARGLNVMLFSDNVSYQDELDLKLQATRSGLIVMGPDCGTSLIAGVPLAFANQVRRGDVGIVGASGTGIQEVSCLIDRFGGGISHAIGTGGRDLSEQIGGLTTLAALDLLDDDSETSHIVLISKPPARTVAKAVLERVAKSPKRFTICFLGAEPMPVPANARAVTTLLNAALDAVPAPPRTDFDMDSLSFGARKKLTASRRWIYGAFCGGTLCSEAQVVLRQAGESFWSNVPIAGALARRPDDGNVLIDYGADEFTIGRPHPMIDPAVRNDGIAAALKDSSVAVVLLDIVIGYGACSDPAGAVINIVRQAGPSVPAIVASVTGTDADPQNKSNQIKTLETAGILVAPSNAQATALAIRIANQSVRTVAENEV